MDVDVMPNTQGWSDVNFDNLGNKYEDVPKKNKNRLSQNVLFLVQM